MRHAANMRREIYRGTVYFAETVQAMAMHPGTLQERLADAMPNITGNELPGAMPDELMDQFRELVAMTTCRSADDVDIAPHLKGEGTIRATCLTMTDAEALQAARLLVHLHVCLQELLPL